MALPRKILHVLNGASGGAAMSTIGLIEALRVRGLEACAVCHDAGTPQERSLLRDATHDEVLFMRLYWWNRKIRAPLWKRPLMQLRQGLITGWGRRSAARLADFARRHEVDLIHTNTIVTPEGGIAALRLGLPHVWHLRELIGPGNPFRLPLEGPALGRYLAEHCSRLVANSEASAAAIRDWLPADLLDVVPNGINFERFTRSAPTTKESRLVIGMVGNLTSRWKKHGLFVDAAARVDRSLPIEWRIYGHDPSHDGQRTGDHYVDNLRARIAAYGLGDRFRFPGFILDPAQIISQLDILVHPADHESFGRVAVEAMAGSLPVVGVRGGGIATVVEHGVTGFLANPDDPADIAACIERLVRDADRRREMGRAGRQRAEALYSTEACADNILRVYEAALRYPLGRPRVTPTIYDDARSCS